MAENEWTEMELEGKKLFYRREGDYFGFADRNPDLPLNPGERQPFIWLARAAEPDESKREYSDVDDCVGCTTIRNEGGKVAPECIHIRAARKIQFGI